jgi:hypothetical protein
MDIKQALDYATEAIKAANPSAYSLVETTLPYTTPTPIAVITAASASTYFGLKGFWAFLFVYSLEGIGLVATTKFVESIVVVIRSRNSKNIIMTLVLLAAVVTYIVILVSINVTIHKEFAADPAFGFALTLICFLPLIAGTLNGVSQIKETDRRTQKAIDDEKERLRLEEIALTEKHRLEDKEERFRRYLIKKGFNPDAAQSPMNTPPVPQQQRDKMPGDFKEYVFKLLDECSGNIKLTEITERVNKDKRVHFIHGSAKGTWYKYVEEWKRSHQ